MIQCGTINKHTYTLLLTILYIRKNRMTVMNSKTLAVAGIVIATIGLAGCTGPSPKKSEMLQLEKNENETSTQDEMNGVETNLSDIQINLDGSTNGTNQNTGDTSMMGETEKTLADFTEIKAKQVTLHTSKGDITFDIYTDKVPLTAQNFLNLAKDGFYDGIVFHRVIENFMAQAGDPLSKDPSKQAMWGTGGPGYVIADEFVPELKHDSAGVVSMANKGMPTTGGSQFFITFEPTPWLDGKHTVFGKVTDGLDVLMNITQGDVITSVSMQ